MGQAEYQLYINGKSVASRSGSTLDSIDPTRLEPWARIADAGAEDVDLAVNAGYTAFHGKEWRALSPTRRGRLLMRLAQRIEERAEDLALIETRDNGKLLREMAVQLRMIPDWLYYFGGLADKIEGRVIPLDQTDVLNYTLREPLGVVAIVTPWNSPLLLTIAALAPAIAAGNTVVLKPSEVSSASTLELMKLVEECGFPPGVINVITGGGEAGRMLVAHPRVAKVSFTGGTATGRRIAQEVGGRLGQCLLELGGKSPNIVFEDADRDAAEVGILAGIFGAAGQTCVAGSRALIHREVYDELVERIVARTENIVVGDPMRDDVQMGPLATEAQLEKIGALVAEARADGLDVLCGGERASVSEFPNGLFYKPTIIAGSNLSNVAQEEMFGPVLTVIPFEDEEEAIRLGNDSPYGLAAGIWTLNVKRAHRVVRRLQAGTVWINMYRGFTFNSPYGGSKPDSGYGRQNGIDAINEYLQTKSVWCDLADAIQDPFVIRT